MAEGLRAYGLIVWMWVRSGWAYRTSFVLMTVAAAVTSSLDFLAILIMFSHVETLGGFTVAEVALLYGASGASLGLADLALGNLDRVGSRIRDGTLDVLLVRPAPVFAQVAADRFAFRRLGRVLEGLGVLGWALTRVEVDWSVGRVVLVVAMVTSGAVIFGAIFAMGGAFQFFAQDAAEVQNAFTYGGDALLQYPPSVFARELVRGVTFAVPLAFVNWLPALRLLGREDPLGLPGWVDFLSPAVAAAMWGVAALVWRSGVRSYRSTGS
ncbi:ABC transporter permease [Streptomyces sp. DSM 44917]|uniref:ABC transporter permease n=1 Tax=Streptomyces boetiae TaxID=3075541 RepID=A0ABU2LCA9_9ACTN|nr:ABC transporter permease [Streptomyces sp. DSM 44917]MDT0308893.1 ABC transporter permease [Streptomyces sp. DSM 44917]